MRVPSYWCTLALLTSAGPLLAQAIPNNSPSASLSLASSFPSILPAVTRPVSQSVDFVFANLSISLRPTFSHLIVSANTHLIGETSLSWQFASSRLPGQLTLGAWSEPADAPTFPGGSRTNTWGPYLVINQMLWRANRIDDYDPRGLGLFFIYDHANTDLVPTFEHFSTGLSFRGLLPSRAHDILGLGLSYAFLTTDPAANYVLDSETAIEAFYKFQLTPHLTLRPDLQYVLDPATTNSADSLIASVRLEFEY